MPGHTFVVLAYGNSPFISECLESLCKQTIKSKIIISTSTNADVIKDLARQYDAQLVVKHRWHSIAEDWNNGLKSSDTELVTLAHQDDIYSPTYAEECVDVANKLPDMLIGFPNYGEIVKGKIRSGNLIIFIKQCILRFNMPFGHSLRRKWNKKLLLAFGSPIPAPGVVYNLKNLKDFTFSTGFQVNMDWDAWYRLAGMPGRIVHIPRVLFYHRIHEDSATTRGLKAKIRHGEDAQMFRRFWIGPVARILGWLYAISYRSNLH